MPARKTRAWINGVITDPIFTFALACLVMELTPGPNMAYLALLSATRGRLAGFSAVAGIAMGLLLVGLAATVGLAELIAQSPPLYQTLKWAGIVYFLWLAWDSWRASPSDQTLNSHFFIRGLITNLLNPKAALFYVTVLPNFIAPGQNILTAGVHLTLIYIAIASTIHLMLVCLAGSYPLASLEHKRQKWVRALSALSLIAIAVWLAWIRA